MASRPGAAHRSDPDSRQENGELSFTRDGFEPRGTVRRSHHGLEAHHDPRSLTGMEKGSVRSRSLHRRPFGTPRACSPYPCAGSFSETRKESSKPRLSLVCTDLEADPEKIVCLFVTRWQLEVTFQEARRHLGLETQRQWSDLAIRRTTPALLGLFSLVTLFAHHQMTRRAAGAFRQVAWYRASDIRPLPMRLRWCERSCGLVRLFTGRPRRVRR